MEKIPGNLPKNLEKSWKYHGILLVRKSGNPEAGPCVKTHSHRAKAKEIKERMKKFIAFARCEWVLHNLYSFP